MHSLHGVEQKEGLAGFVFNMVFEELLALLQENKICLFQVKTLGNHARSAVMAVRVLGQAGFVDHFGRRDGDAIILHIGVNPGCRRAADRSKEMVKATMHGTVRDGPGVVDLLHPPQSGYW